MASDDLMKSWKRTEGYLLDARSHLSEAAERICAAEIQAFEGYLQHYELELALDVLEQVIIKSGVETWRVVEQMALAAASMGLFERQRRYDAQLSNSRRWKYETVLPK